MVKAKKIGAIAGAAGPWDAYVEWYAPSDLEAPHEPDRGNDLAAITESMKRNGWVSRPLLAMRYDEEALICQTGSHRLAAARAAGISEVPVVVIDCTSALEGENPSLDVFELMIDCATAESDDLVAVVRNLWEQDGYPQ